jgi:hypothetical protein
MLDVAAARKLALGFPETEEQDHFGNPSFRIKKKIFMTLKPAEARAVLKLSLVDQSVFCDFNSNVFYPVPGAWGKQGWTVVDLKKVRKDMFRDALQQAFKAVAPKTIVKKYFSANE